jgi:hypothetical protein
MVLSSAEERAMSSPVPMAHLAVPLGAASSKAERRRFLAENGMAAFALLSPLQTHPQCAARKSSG